MNFSALFTPRSIAIIGASTKLQSVGNDVVKNLVTQGYTGKIYPINPKADQLYGIPMFPTIDDIPGNVDLVVIAIPAAHVPDAIRGAAKKGARAAIIISAGFKEIGNTELEETVRDLCREHDITLIGPNCLGVINPEISMNASFAGIMPSPGNVAFISQSGALCTSVLDYAREYRIGFSKFLSIGNKACVDEATLMEYLAQDPQTTVIAMYVEQLEEAERFITIARRVTQGPNPKPILILKSGRTQAGAAAIASHTGSLSGGDSAYDALFAQSGVIRPNTIRELFEFMVIFSQNTLSPVESVAIITNAGGPGVLATDAVISSGLTLSSLRDETVQALQSFLPPAANTHNPIDILGDAKADRYGQTLEVLASAPEIDAVMILLTPQTMTEPSETARAIVRFKEKTGKPLVASFMGQQTVEEGVDILESGAVSTTSFPELAARGLGAMHTFWGWSKQTEKDTGIITIDPKDRQHVETTLTEELAQGRSRLPEATATELVARYGLTTLKKMSLQNPEEYLRAASFFDHPVALKIISEQIVHKSDVGGVILNVDPGDIPMMCQRLLETVHARVPEATLDGVFAVEMAPSNGIELIVGANTIPGLGKLVMVGLGGVYVEIFKDVSLGYAPLTDTQARTMIERLRCHAILQGARGHEGYDIEELVQTISRISRLVTDHPRIQELDINPLLILPKGQGVKVLDARIMLAE